MKEILAIKNPTRPKTLSQVFGYEGDWVLKHVLFWIAIYACNVIANWEDFPNTTSEIFLTHFYRIIFQIVSAYAFLYIILPRYEQKKSKIELVTWSFLLLIIVHTIYRIFKVTYFEVVYPDTYTYCQVRYAGWTLTDRLLNMNGLFFKGPAIHFLPALLLVAWQYFEKQQKVLTLNEQKKAAELNVLKNQLNPHFLFNTLNNLYALARKKSDETPKAISKLSEILDYTLYGCNEDFVAISKEVDLINNYLELEKIRYGERADVRFTTDIQHPQQIAPLLFLTFLENAYKHGVSQELHQATLLIHLKTTVDEIIFSIKNSIPKNGYESKTQNQGIGLKNIRKQLDLLYPNAYQLQTENKGDCYHVELKIKTK